MATKAQQWARLRNPAYYVLRGYIKSLERWLKLFDKVLLLTERASCNHILSELDSLSHHFKTNSKTSKTMFMSK